MLTQMMSVGVYDIQEVKFNTRTVITNTTTIGAYRGAGRPEATQLIERVIDVAAQKIGMDPAEIRRRNFIQPAAFPLVTNTGASYDSGEYEKALDAVLAAAGYTELRAEQAKRRAENNPIALGIGVSAYVEVTAPVGLHVEFGAVEINDDGSATVFAGTSELPPPTQSGPRTTTSSGVAQLDTDPARTFTHLSFPSGASVVWTGKEALQATRVIARLDGSSAEGCDIDSIDREVGTDRGRPLPVAIRGSIQLPELCRNHRYDVLVAFRDRRGMVAVYASHPRLFDDLSDTVTERRVLPNLAVELDSTGRRVSATVDVSMPPELRGQPFSIRSASVEFNGDDVVAFPQPNVALLFGPTDCAAPRRVSGPAGGVRARAPGQVHLRATIIVKVGANCETARTLVIQRDELITISNNVRSAIVTLERPDGMRALVNVSWP